MSIDETDHAPRPADDYLSKFPPRDAYPVRDDFPRAYSIIVGRRIRRENTFCHQLGVAFAELPHAQ